MNLTLEKYIAIAILALSSCAVIWITVPVWVNQNVNDDAFITLTYAKNLVEGRGFVYNHPPATLGTTTPLFTFITVFLAAILPFFTVIQTAILLSVMAWLGAAWMLYLMLRETKLRPVPSAVAASVSLLAVQEWVFWIGMEAWLFQFLLVLSVYLSFRKKLFYAGLCTAALFLTRGEGALAGIILFGYLWFSERKIPIRFVLGAGIILIMWLGYSMATFGTFVPNTLAAKRAQAQLSSGRYFIQRMLFELLPNHFRSFAVFGFWFLNPYLILIGLGVIYAFRRNRVLFLFIVWALAYLTAYAILNPKPYYWYVLNVVFVLELMAGVGLAWLLTIVHENRSIRSRLVTSLATVALAFAMLYPNLRFIIFQSQDFLGDPRAPAYKAVAGWLNENTDSEESVAFIEIGYLGYFTDNRIIDLAGLTDPLITKHLVTEGFTWGFWHYKPDYYIYAEEFDWALGDIKSAIGEYTMVHQVMRDNSPGPIYIFKRNDG
jgi:hypothetical protein